MKTIGQIIAEEEAANEAFEAAEMVGEFTVAELRKVMDHVQNPLSWKLEWAAAVPHQLVGAVLAAVEFFHADRAEVVGIEPITGRVLMRGKGYQA